MAGPIGEVDIIIGGDASSFVKTAQQVGRDVGASLQKDLSTSLSKVGKSFESVGSKLTKSITLPAAGVAVAAAGITAAFGWKRLVGIDTAQSQLKGLGYSTEDVERISGQLTKALEGGMLTMGEATSAAASGMAAGVKEGKELTRYIQLLDAAVVGGSGSFDEMNQIFSRIQGSGKLMSGELDMIEQRMPGFASAVAKELGVPPEKMREMVSAGKVSSDQFLDIMDGFAGGMAKEYAKSWEGMVQNTQAYIGIIGQSLLSGVFEQSKESIAQFLELLQSDAVQTWAAETGVVLGEAFSKLVNGITGLIQGFLELPSGVQAGIGAFVAAAVAAGPLLIIIGKIMQAVAPVTAAFGVLSAGLRGYSAAASGVAGASAKVAAATSAQRTAVVAGAGAQSLMSVATTRLKGAFTGLFTVMKANPLITIVTILAVLGAALAAFFTQTETGRALWDKFMVAMEPVGELLTQLGEKFATLAGDLLTALGPAIEMLIDSFGSLMESLMPVFEQLAATAGPILAQIGEAFGQIVTQLTPLIPMFMQAGQQIVAAFMPVVAMIVGELVPVFMELVTTLVPMLLQVFAALVPVVMQVVAAVVPLVVQLVSALVPVITTLVTTLLPVLMQVFMAIIPVILQVVAALLPLVTTIISVLVPAIQAILNVVVTVFQAIAPIIQAALQIVIGVINVVLGVLTGDWSRAWNGIKTILQGVWNLIKSVITGAINIVKSVITNGLDLISSVWDSVWNGIKSLFSGIWDGIKSLATTYVNGMQNIIVAVIQTIQNKWNQIWNSIKSAFISIVNGIVNALGGFVNSIRSKFNSVTAFLGSIPGRIKGFFSGMGSLLINSGASLIDGFKQGIMNAFGAVKSAVSGGLSKIRNLFPFSPAKEGPFSGRGWVSYSGESLGDTFAKSAAESLRAGVGDVSNSLDPMQGLFSSPAGLLPMARSVGASRPTTTGAGTTEQPMVIQGPLVNIENARMDSDDRVRQLAQELWTRSNRTSRAQGKINLGGVVR